MFLQDDPLHKGYQRVDQTEDALLSKSPTGTSLETVVLDTNADNLIGGDSQLPLSRPFQSPPRFKSPPPEPNPFAEELKQKLAQQPRSVLKDSRVSFEDNYEDEAADKLEDNFAAQRAHFQKYKSHSSATKRLLLNVSSSFNFMIKEYILTFFFSLFFFCVMFILYIFLYFLIGYTYFAQLRC